MSKARRLSVPLLVVALFVAAPVASAQDTIQNPYESTPTTLYFHIFDTINKFVINTQPMDSEFFEVGGANFPTTPDLGRNEVPGTGLPLDRGWDMNTIYGYSTAGPVEYEFIENGRPRFHPERGIAATVDIDKTVDPMVYMYLDPRDVTGTANNPTLSPQFHLEITFQEGDDPGLNANLDAGKDIMHGRTTFHMADAEIRDGVGGTGAEASANDQLSTFEDASPDGTPIFIPNKDGIVEVPVKLDVLQEFIPKKDAYNVRIDWYQTDPADGAIIPPDQFTTGWLRLASTPDYLPRLEFNIMNPIYFSFIHPQVAGGSLLIHAGGNSPWGTYDVDLDGVTIEMTHDETGKTVPEDQLKKLLNSNEHVHGLHDEDTQITYLWDFREFNAPIGEYTIRMSITNDAKDDDGDYADSSVAWAEAGFIVTETEAIGIDTSGQVVEPSVKEEVVESPGIGVFATVALLGAALLFARKRQTQ